MALSSPTALCSRSLSRRGTADLDGGVQPAILPEQTGSARRRKLHALLHTIDAFLSARRAG